VVSRAETLAVRIEASYSSATLSYLSQANARSSRLRMSDRFSGWLFDLFRLRAKKEFVSRSATAA
jgi:hypothetical protein